MRAKDAMTLRQILALVACGLVNVQDGFDILAISYAAGDIGQDLGLANTQLGYLLSAGLAGMMLGSIFIGPFADYVGRKTVCIGGLFVSGCGMLAAGASSELTPLIIARLFTGIGIGAILAAMNTLVGEFVSPRWRTLAIALFQGSYPLGAVVGGFVAAWILQAYSWHGIFYVGAVAAFTFIPILWVLVPESNSFLAARHGAASLGKINANRAKMGMPPVADIGEILPPKNAGESGVLAILKGDYLLRTLLMCGAFFSLLMTFYFVLSWLPKIIADFGYGRSGGISAGILLNSVGLIGILVLSAFSLKRSAAGLAVPYILGAAVTMAVFKLAASSELGMYSVIAVAGFFMNGAMIALYALVPTLYPPSMRATGTGFVIGVSRSGAVVGPAAAGILLDTGFQPINLFALFSIPAVLAAAAVATIAWQFKVTGKEF